ncbi:Hypothetical predicted protein [Mytilus galloprovincialis]|uniref:Uncharacterized protein n=1 Tax=Mytilus galloprovincialis TaxID=29158 RepID=A0A8B6CXJ7_MYTGA|nr:Hypothetical predicted protein [Mytilus galloprovincialis]
MLFQIADKDFTSNALYHSGCITKYLLREKEIKAETDENNTGTMYDKAFTSFVESISEELFVHKMVFSLSYLLSKYKSFLPEDVSSKYTSYRLQLRLKNHFREHIVVDVNHGQGESNFVYSSSLTLREAVRTAIRFKAETKFTKLQMSACTSKNDQTDENQILYSAASILRREIKNAVVPMDTYPSVDEMSLSKSLETVPSVLTGFINWLIDDSHSQVDIKNHLSDIPFESKIWGDGGLRDLLVDSGVYAAATVDQMLSGKQFNRAVRGLTLLYETLKTLWICSFFVWIRQQKCLEIPESLFVGLTECHESFTSYGRTFDVLQSLEKALNDDLWVKNERVSRMGWSGFS